MAEDRKKRAARPRDAASLVLVRRDRHGTIEVLMGQRNARHRFMPESYVFPGGRVDPREGAIDFGVAPKPYVLAKLTKACSAQRALALLLAAIRETFEETGLLVGKPLNRAAPARVPGPWRAFLDQGLVPALDQLHYVARAITPPFRPIRFHARFFMVDAAHVSGQLGGSGELEFLRWLPIEEAEALPVPSITARVLKEVDRLMAAPRLLDDPERPVIAYRTLHGKHAFFHD